MNEKLIDIGLASGMLNYVDNETPRHYFLTGYADEMDLEQFYNLMAKEFISLLEAEIKLVKRYNKESFNVRDREWHEGKIAHFQKMIDKTKKHFGVV